MVDIELWAASHSQQPTLLDILSVWPKRHRQLPLAVVSPADNVAVIPDGAGVPVSRSDIREDA